MSRRKIAGIYHPLRALRGAAIGGKVCLSMNRTPRFTTITEGLIIMTALTTAEVAAKFDTTPRTLRKFLRADARANDAADTLPGKGSRYSLEAKSLRSLQARFKKWEAAEAAARADRAQKAAEAAQAEVDAPEVDDEVDTDEG
jgi:hypothetical protein